MKHIVVAMAAASLGCSAPSLAQEASPRPPAAADIAQPAAVVDAFHAALGRGDTAAAATLLSADALIYESGRAERSKAEYLSHHLPADAAFARATRRTVTDRSGRVEGGLAWIASQSRTTGTYKSKPIDSLGTETMLLRREGGAWRIIHIHWSSANT